MVRMGRIITLIGLVVAALGVAQFALGMAVITESGTALAAEFGWVLDNNHNPYPFGNPLLMLLAFVVGAIIAAVGMVKSRSKFSRWI
jgi:ribose/xylose/arabinose/galactoside ABC-type transport system permease subunit